MTPPGTDSELTPEQEKALSALLGHSTVTAAATAAGLSRSSLRRMLLNPDFAAAYREARQEVLRGVTSELRSACSLAVRTLKRVMRTGASESARVTAAAKVLEHAYHSQELELVEERLSALEAAQQGKENRR